MAKQLNVALNFTAETGQAKTAIQDLQASLSKIAYAGTGNIVGNSAQQIKEASEAAKQLQYHLNNAYNATTGNFDLSRLDKSLQSSKTNIADLSAKLLGAGSAGQQAFAQLAQSISMADQPMFRVNTKLTQMLTTLKNTARWQISSSILHGFMGTIQHAYGYAQDLNESLNNIRIVTGQSVDQMAKFAEQANKSAKALSATTTEYTNASLIYYQQGLSDAEVKERTDVTIKMANVAGVSAQTVSDQMTAVWNNFDDGSKSLEYYADVMTALGAATASSTDEIADGLEKFAAVSETVGLSYEYATAALATVTATTRQSADVVGNAFKTLFARIQGLNLGETLEDGTTLNKYSQALEKVGISIFEQNGQMKEMDDILDEMGAKWDALDKAQQTALAQTVAGVRQYTQLIALMDNWDYFKENLGVAYGAEGELNKQAEIYAESWEAARDRVAAAAESIYQNLLDDKFFITINNGFADLLSGLNEFIKGIGGAKGIITMFASIMLSNFSHKIPEAIQNLSHNFKILTKGTKEAYAQIHADMDKATQQAFSNQNGKSIIKQEGSTGFMITSSNQLAIARAKLAEVSDRMSSSERQLAEMELSLAQAQQQELFVLKQQNEEKLKSLQFDAQSVLDIQTADLMSESGIDSDDLIGLKDSIARAISSGMAEGASQGKEKFSVSFTQALAPLKTEMTNIMTSSMSFEDKQKGLISLLQLLPQATRSALNLNKAFDEIGKAKNLQELEKAFKGINFNVQLTDQNAKELVKLFKTLFNGDAKGDTLSRDLQKIIQKLREGAMGAEELKTSLESFDPSHAVKGIEALTSAAGSLGSIAMIGNSLVSMINTLSDPDTSGWQKLSSVLMGVSMIIPAVSSSLRGLGTVQSYINTTLMAGSAAATAENVALVQNSIETIKNVATKRGKINAEQKQAAASILAAAGIDENTLALNKNDGTTLKNLLAKELAAGASYKEAINNLLSAGAIDKDTAAKLRNLVATNALNIAKLATVAVLALIAAGIFAVVAARQQEIKTTEEMAEKAREEAAAQKEAVEETKNLVKSYKDALTTYEEAKIALDNGTMSSEEFANAQANLAEQAQKVAESLGVEGAALAKLSGDYSKLTEAIEQAQYDQIVEAQDKETIAKETTGQEFIDDMRGKTGRYTMTDSFKARFTQGIDGWMDEQEINNIISQSDYQYLKKSALTGAVVLESGQSVEEMIAAYEEAQDLYNKAISSIDSAELAKSEVFQNLKKFLDKSAETYEAYKASEEVIQEYGTQLKARDKIDEIKDIESYNRISKELIKEIAPNAEEGTEEWNEAAKAVHAYLGALSGISEWATKSQAIEEISKKTGSTYEDILAEYNKLDSEEKELFFSVNFDLPGALENLESTLDYLQEMADGKKIQAQLELVAQGEDLLKDGGSLQEWAAWAAEIQKYDKNFDIAKFLSMTDEDQAEWLNNYENNLKQQSREDRVQDIAAMDQHLAYLESINTDSAAEERDANAARMYELRRLQALENTDSRTAEEEQEYTNLLNKTENSGLTGEALTSEIEGIQKEIDIYDSLQAEMEETRAKRDELQNLEDLENQLGWTEGIKEEAELEGIDYNEIKEYANYLQEVNGELKNHRDLAEEQALSYKKWQKGIKTITDNFEDWTSAIKNQEKDFSKYASTVEEIKDAYKDIFNEIDPSLIEALGDEFLTSEENMALWEEGINGNEDAWNQWETNVLQRLNEVTPAFQGMSDQMIAQMDDLVAHAAGLDFSGLTPGASIDDSDFNAKLNSMVFQTADAAQAMCDNLSNVGVDAEIEKHTVTVPPTAELTEQSGNYIYTPPNSTPVNIPISASHVESSSGTTYTWYTLKGAKYNGKGITPGGGSNNKGGGGGGKPKTPEKKNDSDKTRYHTITNQLEDLKSEYDAIAKASDRAFGANKLAKMDDEIAKTDELIEKQKEYVEAIDANLPMDKAIMVEYYNEVIGGPEMEFDEKGNISNYDAIQDAMYKAWNEDYYNLPEEEREAWEEKYEKVEKYIEQYEETYDLLRDEEQALQDLINQRLDLLLEEVQYEVELKLNVSDDSLQLIEFQLNMLEDNAFKAAEAIEYQTEQAEILYDKMQANEQGLRDILATSDMSVSEIEQLLAGDTSVLDGHTFTEAQIEAIREYRDNLLDLSEELQEVREEVQERLLDAFDEWNEELDEGIEKFDHYNSIMENYKNMIEIVGKEYLKIDNKALGNLDQAMVENNINRVKATKDALDALTDTEIRARQAYEDAVARGNENDIQYWKETLETIGDEVESAEEEMMQAWEDALQAAADAFEAAVESAIENFEKALLPFGTLEEFSDAYEKQQEVADQYLDDYQQIYELSKLNRDIANSMDDTKSIAGKQKLKGLMDDINKLQEEGTQLSEYDLEYLQKTYDLRMAEIALEEAQKAKDTVRLTRDNEGNWSYAYTTNTDAADDAAQKYEDALYAMQELSSEYIDEMSEQLISTSQEMEEALAAVRVEDYASIEEYYKKLDEIQQYYLDRMGYMQGEMQKALDNNKALYEQDWQNYSAATGYKISDDEKFAMSYKDTVLGTLFGSESDLVDFQERVNEALGTSDSGLIGELLDAYLQWSQNTDDAMNAAGTSSEDFAEDMDTAVHGEGGIVDSSTAATDAVDKMATQMVAGFDTISSAVERWQSQVGDAADAVIKDYLETVTAYNMMVEALSSNKVNKALEESLASHSARVSSYANSTNSTGSKNASDSIAESTYTTGNGPSAPDRSTSYYEFKARQADRLATGGYTGNWGPDPKWALLDSAEIVLNEKDTSNFLSAISLTREMLNTIDLNAQQASVGLGAMVAGAIKQDILQGLEQSVHITAEFPSVTDHYEVEEALNNLINTSSQYANRK